MAKTKNFPDAVTLTTTQANAQLTEEVIPMAKAKTKTAKTTTEATDVNATLAERGNRYGPFTGHAYITQRLKVAMMDMEGWDSLAPDQKEALDMIAHKIGRILNGDPNYHDSWHDIVGYAKLVADRLETGVEV